MKKTGKYILLLLLIAVFLPLQAQIDSRNRTVETIIQDGLAQLPTKTPQSYQELMREMAQTGKQGTEMLCGMLMPAEQGKNASFEYAIDGIVSYVSDSRNSNLRNEVRQGLVCGIEKCTNNVNKAFLLSQLQKIAISEDATVFVKYIKDDYLKPFAVNGLAVTQGTEKSIRNLIQNNGADKSSLAYLAYVKKMTDVEDELLSWTKDSDKEVVKSAYRALSVCGGKKAVTLLGQTVASHQYAIEELGALDCYLQLLSCGKYQEEAITISKVFINNPNTAIRCAALKLLLESNNKIATKTILTALKDPCRQYRNTALDNAEQNAGSGIYQEVASKIKKLPNEAKVDVVRWLGNHHRKEQIDIINQMMNFQNGKDSALTRSAIESAGKIGGSKAMAALINQLKGDYATEANKALLSFNGNISNSIMEAIDSQDRNIQQNALKLASTRRLYKSYNKVLNLAKSSDPEIRAAAYKALAGVSVADNFNELCDLMEKADATTSKDLQNAAKNAIATKTAMEQYKMIAQRMASTSTPTLYYPLLAQAGTDESITKLQQEYAKPATKDEAFKGLLLIDNPEMIDVLYNMAETDSEKKDQILNRYRVLVKKGNNNPTQKYLLYRRALELNPSEKTTNTLLAALSEAPVLPSLIFSAKYLDSKKNKEQAAKTVKQILSKNSSFQQGIDARRIMEKARDIFKAQTDADAGYAIDELNGMIAKSQEGNGFNEVMRGAEGSRVRTSKDYENFEMYVDWKSLGDDALLKIKNLPQVQLGTTQVSMLAPSEKSHILSVKPTEWNTLYLKVENDRLEVKNNGETVASNYIMNNGDKPLDINGVIELLSEKGKVSVRNLCVKEKPSTPVYTLSEEEQKAGFELLFDGRSLEKWQGNTTDYVPVEGNIYVSAKYGGSGNLYTKKKYSDFVYRFEFSFVEPGVNNGIGVRTHIGTDAAYDGMEIQVLDHDDPIYKNLQPYQQHGAVYGIIVPKHVTFGKLNTWNTEEIRIVGDDIKVTVNGEVILEGNIREACQGYNVAPDGGKKNPYTVDHKNHPGLFNPEGYVSFCGHGAGVKFRNVRILDLSKQKNIKKKTSRKK